MDGGVSSNDFVMQLTADLFGRKVARPEHYEMSCLGAAFVAGLGVGRQAHTHTQYVHYAVYFLSFQASDSCGRRHYVFTLSFHPILVSVISP